MNCLDNQTGNNAAITFDLAAPSLSHKRKLVDSNSAYMWSPTRIGPSTDSISVIHDRFASTSSSSWFGTHLYADDTQVYGFCHPASCMELQNRISVCISDVAKWIDPIDCS